jgi:hypothetical protein
MARKRVVAHKGSKKAGGKPRRGKEPAVSGRRQTHAFVAPGVEWTRATLQITFDGDRQLVRKLRQILAALEARAPAPPLPTAPPRPAESPGEDQGLETVSVAPPPIPAAAGAPGQCMSIVGATQVVIDALSGKPVRTGDEAWQGVSHTG